MALILSTLIVIAMATLAGILMYAIIDFKDEN